MIKTIESAKIEIIDAWLSQESVINILKKYKVSLLFFKKHFAYRIFHSFMKVVNEEKTINECPVLYVLLHFSNKQLIPFHELFLIYAGLKNEIFTYIRENKPEHLSKEDYRSLANFFDLFFAGLIQDALDQIAFPIHIDTATLLAVKSELKGEMNIEDRIHDIRFSKEERYGSDVLFEILGGSIVDKIEQFTFDLDTLLLLLYDMEEIQGEQAQQLMFRATQIIDEFYHLVDVMVVFPVISSTFRNLYQFLRGLDIDFYDNLEQKNSLILNLIGLIKDLEQWIDIVFIKRIAEDVHYLDASFANNVIEIESICNNKQIVTNEEDDLEFF